MCRGSFKNLNYYTIFIFIFTLKPFLGIESMCSVKETHQDMHTEGVGLSGPFMILIVASIVSAQGSSPIYCLGIPYIEENLEQGDASFYVGKNTTLLFLS